jgi:hypothetical protein
MTQRTIIGTVAVGIIVLLGLWYVLAAPATPSGVPIAQVPTSTGASAPDIASVIPKKPVTVAPIPSSSTYVSLFTATGNHECDYEQVTTTGRNSNVIYIADGKMRGEFRSTVNGNTTGTLMIYTGGYLYTWNEGMTTGTKTSITKLSQLPSIIPTDFAGGSIIGNNSENVGWFCHNWNKDPAMLQIPSYVSFTTL